MGKHGTKYFQSKYAHVLKIDNTQEDPIFALYHSLSMEIIFVNEVLARLFQKNDRIKQKNFPFLQRNNPPDGIEENKWNTILDSLITKQMVVEEGTDDSLMLKTLQKEKRLEPIVRIRLMYLFPTYACNLACKYCSVTSALEESRESQSSQFMTQKTSFKAIDLFHELLHPHLKNYKIIFYGGEPLLNWPVVKASLEYITKKNKNQPNERKVKPALLTNGILMTKDIAQSLKKHHCSVSVSIDGPMKYHDLFRVDKSGQGSFKESVQAIRILKDAEIKPAISCTLPLPNIDNIEEICAFLHEKLDIKMVGFNPVRNLPLDNPYPVSSEKTTVALLKAFEIFREKGIYEDRIMRKVQSFVNKEIYAQDCAGYGCQIAVGPQGEIGPCHLLLPAHTQLIGSIFDPDIRNKIQNGLIMTNWARRKPIFMEFCETCEYLGICGGGCAAESLRKEGDLFSIDKDFCGHTKLVIQWLIKDLFLKSKTTKPLSV